MNLLLDTNAYSALRRGHQQVAGMVRSAELLHLPLPVVGELLYGFSLGRRESENRIQLQEFIAQPKVRLAPLDLEVCACYARIGKALRTAGTPIPSNDQWIAAIALRSNFTLLSRDRHFQHVSGLHWVAFTAS